MRFLSLLVLSILCSQGFAQDLLQSPQASHYTYIYKLSEQQAKQLYLEGPLVLPEEAFSHLVDSFRTTYGRPASLAAGHYVQAKVVNTQLQLQYLPVQAIQLQVLNDQTSLHLMAFDVQGNRLPDAQITLNGKAIPFDEQSATFHAPRRARGGLVEISYQGQTNWYTLDNTRSKWNFRRMYSWVFNLPTLRLISWRLFRLGYAIAHPYRFLEMPRYWLNYFVRQSQTLFNPYNKYRSYVSHNKPIYRPGDTLKAKFVVLKARNGQAVDGEFGAYTFNRNREKIDIPVQHPRPGVYLIDWVLADSLDLQLDAYSYVYLDVEKRRPDIYTSFRYEDYELNRVRFETRIDSNKVYKGLAFLLYASAKDENNLAVPDARIKLSLFMRPGANIIWKTNRGFMPDTLWQWEQKLDPLGETIINIPDSIWPEALFSAQLATSIFTSDNEVRSQQYLLEYKHQEANISFREGLDSLEIHYHQNAQSIPQTAWVEYLDRAYRPIWQDSLSLPLVLPLRGTFSHIRVNCQGQSRTFAAGKSLIQVGGKRTTDSLFIESFNPRGLPIWYSLFKGNKLIEQGESSELELRRSVGTREYYFLSTRYVWDGQVVEQDFRFNYYPNKVNLQLDHPQQVAPGTLVPIKISAEDIDQQAIADFDLTLYGYTAKFQETSAPKIPIWAPQWENRYPKNSFKADSDFDRSRRNRLVDYPFWAKKIGLDSLAWYQFRYPAGERYQYTFSIEDSSSAQFAPYVFERGLQCNPVIIYLDDKPVFYQAQANQAFAFRTTEGYHNIKVRLDDRLIEMDSVWLAAGQKKIVSVDKTKLGPKTTWRSAKPELSSLERRIIETYFVWFRFSNASKLSISQGESIHFFPRTALYGNHLLGPFRNNLPLKIQGSGWSYEVPKQIGYRYTIYPRYAQLVSEDFWKNKKTSLSAQKGEPYEISTVRSTPPIKSFGQNIIGLNQSQLLWLLLPKEVAQKDCRLETHIPDIEQKKVLFTEIVRVNSSESWIYPSYISSFNSLPPGQYKIHYWQGEKELINRRLISPSFDLKPKGINYCAWKEDLDDSAQDSSLYEFLQRLKKTEARARDSIRSQMNGEGFAFWINGRILEKKDRYPLSFATVLHFDEDGKFRSGGNTDINGFFSIPVFSETFKIQVRYLGNSFERTIDVNYWDGEILLDNISDVNMDKVRIMSEVVLTGYGTTAKMSEASSVVFIDGVKIRGEATLPQSSVRQIRIREDITRDVSTVAALTPGGYQSGTMPMDSLAAEAEIKGGPFSFEKPEFQGEASGSSLRTNFRDYAFWYPNLKTGPDGTVEIKARIPDDITQWHLFALGHNEQRQIGKTTSQMQAYRMLSGQIVLPRFLLPGDSVRLIGKSINYAGDTVGIETEFALNDTSVLRSRHQLTRVALDTAYFSVPRSGNDSLTFRYQLTRTEDGYWDGEERKVPLYRAGVEETEGKFWAFWQDSSLSYQGDSSMGPLYVNLEADLLPSLRTEIRRLRSYPYECNEQSASKLMAFLHERKISEQLGESFRGNNEIKRLIRRLLRHQNEDASWGWWPNMPGQMWVSLHVVEALMMAQEAGFTVSLNTADIKARLLFEWESYSLLDQYRALDLLSQLEAKLNYQGILDSLLPSSYGHSRYLVENYLLRQRYELPMEMDSLLKLRKQSQFGSYFWGNESYQVTDNAFLTSLRVYELLKAQADRAEEAALTLNYILAGRKPYYWRNTYESAQVLAVILADIVAEQGQELKPQIWVNGAKVDTFPFRDTLAANAQLELRFEGRLPVYATAYQHYWNTQPQAAQKPFAVKTYFVNSQNDTIEHLKSGQKVLMIAEVKLESSADYVALRLPIPAGCSYLDKRSWWRGESYREYKREQTEIYCLRLPAGTHRFEVSLMPRFAGNFGLRTTRAEMMYFPLFFGQNAQKRVEIR